jgi:hypothetical protein
MPKKEAHRATGAILRLMHEANGGFDAAIEALVIALSAPGAVALPSRRLVRGRLLLQLPRGPRHQSLGLDYYGAKELAAIEMSALSAFLAAMNLSTTLSSRMKIPGRFYHL